MSPSLLLGSVVFLVLCAGVFGPLQALRPQHGQRQRWSVIVIACGLFLCNQQLIELCGPPLIALLHGWVGHVAVPDTTGAMVGRIVLLLILIDLGEYALHRVMHAHPLLWRLHRVHHQPEVVTWQVAWYQHPADALLHALLAGVLGVLLGVDLSAIVGLVLLRKLWTSCLHADVDLRLGWFGRVIATPAFHRLHHARCHNHNFSATFPLWDQLFGTALESDSTRILQEKRRRGEEGRRSLFWSADEERPGLLRLGAAFHEAPAESPDRGSPEPHSFARIPS